MLNIAAILAAFDVRRPLDESGEEYDPEIEYVSTITRLVLFTCGVLAVIPIFDVTFCSHPKPFKCRIIPRAHARVFMTE